MAKKHINLRFLGNNSKTQQIILPISSGKIPIIPGRF